MGGRGRYVQRPHDVAVGNCTTAVNQGANGIK